MPRVFTLPAGDTIIQPPRVLALTKATAICLYSADVDNPATGFAAPRSVIAPNSVEQPPFRYFIIQNCGTVPVKIKLNDKIGGVDDFHTILPACTAKDDGTSQPVDFAGDKPRQIWAYVDAASDGRIATYRSGNPSDDKI